jgi:hypothetical protein
LEWLEGTRNDTFVLGNPQKTYDNRIHIEGRVTEWMDEAVSLSSVEDFITEAQSVGKYKRDIPDGIPGLNQTTADS